MPARVDHPSDAEAMALVASLGLSPHPEGGFYRETWRDQPADEVRGTGTAILFLLRAFEASRWHRVDGTEIWHAYRGVCATLWIATAEGPAQRVLLGHDLQRGEQPQAIVPPWAWQQTLAGDGWALFGCTVSPAFEFQGFEMAAPDFICFTQFLWASSLMRRMRIGCARVARGRRLCFRVAVGGDYLRVKARVPALT